jgi:hypothetical protein
MRGDGKLGMINRTRVPAAAQPCPVKSKAVDEILSRPPIVIPRSLVDTGLVRLERAKPEKKASCSRC